jgi:thiol-disulfide isomerase/thioredoxin
MKIIVLFISAFLAVACTSISHVSPAQAADHPEARPFDQDPSLVAQDTVDEALAAAKLSDKHAIIVMGADWCHDSRALAGWFKTPRFEAMLEENFIVRYIDVGQKDRNIDVAQRFGLENIVGTPTIIVTDSQGRVLNLDSAPTWRNAASRTENSIFEYFSDLAPATE